MIEHTFPHNPAISNDCVINHNLKFNCLCSVCTTHVKLPPVFQTSFLSIMHLLLPQSVFKISYGCLSCQHSPSLASPFICVRPVPALSSVLPSPRALPWHPPSHEHLTFQSAIAIMMCVVTGMYIVCVCVTSNRLVIQRRVWPHCQQSQFVMKHNLLNNSIKILCLIEYFLDLPILFIINAPGEVPEGR